jgi:hypothetical protein
MTPELVYKLNPRWLPDKQWDVKINTSVNKLNSHATPQTQTTIPPS